MAFIRTKKRGGNRYSYLVEAYRDENGKPRQRVLEYLGKIESPHPPRPSAFGVGCKVKDSLGQVGEVIGMEGDRYLVRLSNGLESDYGKFSLTICP